MGVVSADIRKDLRNSFFFVSGNGQVLQITNKELIWGMEIKDKTGYKKLAAGILRFALLMVFGLFLGLAACGTVTANAATTYTMDQDAEETEIAENDEQQAVVFLVLGGILLIIIAVVVTVVSSVVSSVASAVEDEEEE